jgi:phosphatidate cytidylyltransferase
MSNFLKRLILTIVGIPLILFIVFWPQKTHLVLIALYGFFITIVGSIEFSTMLNKKGIINKGIILSIFNTFIYIFSYFYVNNILNIQRVKGIWLIFFTILIFCISFLYSRDILKKDLSLSLDKVAFYLLGILYIGLPSFFIPFILNIDYNPAEPVPIFKNINSYGTLTGSLFGFLLLTEVFTSDIFSYVFGMAFGRNNRLNLEASPNKSWAGYIGGYISIFFWVTLYYIFFDRVFHLITNPWWFYYGLTLISGIIIPIGDLVESVFKRSAQIKDSGTIMGGRGGILDSADTALYYIPIYFMILQIYFTFYVTK